MRTRILIALILLCVYTEQASSQSLAVNTDGSTANASALLDVKSTVKGMLIPRMTRTERNAIASPATGLLIFQNGPDSVGFYYYTGSRWTWIFSVSNTDTLAWKTGGNSGTVDGSHFIGTIDNIPWSFRVNNQKAGRIDHINWNSFFGYQAGNANSSGIHNTAVGYQAFQSNLSGSNNTAIGTLASNSISSGSENSSLGYGSQYLNTVGNGNTTYGFYSMYNNVAGSFGTAIGYQSMLYANNTTTPFTNTNVALGHESMRGNAPASGNTGLNLTAIGYQTLFNNSSGNNNTATGYHALYSNTTADDNTATGTDALYSNTTGAYNTATGFYSLRNNTKGANNVAIGSPALYFNTTAGNNVAIGNNALFTQSYSNGNTAWKSENVAIGDSALFANEPTAITTGYMNTAVGSRSLRTNTFGYQNTALGQTSLFSNTDGWLNTGAGWATLYKNIGGYYNTAIGAMAMYYNTTGNYNTGVGTVSLHHNLTGTGNTAVGQQAGLGTLGNSFSYNTLIGYQSGYNLTTGSNNVFLGSQAGYNVTSASNKLYIANSTTDPPLIYGDFSSTRVGLGTVSPAEKLEINGNLAFTGTSTIYSGTGTNLTIRPGDGTGSGGSLTIRGGNAGIASGGAGGDLNLNAGSNLPAGGAGYGGLGVPGNVNINGSSGYNSVGGSINIKAGQTSCWSLAAGSHSDVNLTGGLNLSVTDAGSIVVQGGYTIGTSCPPPGATGGNIIISSGLGSGTGSNGTIQLMNGNVGIGTAAPTQKLHVVGNICYTGSIAACSDLRYKTNILPLQNSLPKLLRLQGVSYDWKRDAFPDMNFSGSRQVGFIAQDLEKLFPEMVFTDSRGYKSIDYSRLTPVLVETIKEQQKQIDEIMMRLKDLEKKGNR